MSIGIAARDAVLKNYRAKRTDKLIAVLGGVANNIPSDAMPDKETQTGQMDVTMLDRPQAIGSEPRKPRSTFLVARRNTSEWFKW